MMHIEVLGLGCPKCARLSRRVVAAAQRLGIECRVDRVSDLTRIIETGAPVPALVVDGSVKSAGLVPGDAEIEKLLVST
jgi:small redox-active disulfide protein 2